MIVIKTKRKRIVGSQDSNQVPTTTGVVPKEDNPQEQRQEVIAVA
jgi:hypothetical protein